MKAIIIFIVINIVSIIFIYSIVQDIKRTSKLIKKSYSEQPTHRKI